MRVAPRQISDFIARPAPQMRAFLCYGFDQGLARERLASLAKNLPSDEIINLDAQALAGGEINLQDQVLQASLFGGKSIILINGSDLLRDQLIKLLPQLNSDSHYILCRWASLRQGDKLLTAFTNLESCAAIACYPDEGGQLEYFARGKLREHGLSLSQDTLAALVGALGEDREQNRLEMEKILLYAGKDKDKLEQAIFEVLEDTTAFALKSLIAGLFSNHSAVAHAKASSLMNESPYQAILILRSIARYAGRLLACKALQASGMDEEKALAKLSPPVMFRERPLFIKHLRSLDAATLEKIEALMITAEENAKLARPSQSLALERALLETSLLIESR